MGEKKLRKLVQSWAKPRYENVEGAPFFIGAIVEVCCVVDETENSDVVGKRGVVRYYEYDCGSGQTFPDDPMIGVKFVGGAMKEFWKEELKLLERHVSRRT